MDKIQDLFKWSFMQEPIWRWFIFLIAITFFSAAWARVLHHMKAAG